MTPLRAEAGLLSSFLGGDTAYADARPSLSATNDGNPTGNSQNIDLLEANVTSALIATKKTASKEAITDTSTSAGIIVADNALVPTAGAMSGTGGPEDNEEDVSIEDISVYVIRKGDTIGQIAEMFDVSANTILWTNDMKRGDPLKEGEILLIMPTSGVKHTVAKGDTLAGIAKKYKVEVTSITDFNDIAPGEALTVGQEIFVPDGEMPVGSPSSSSTKKPGTKIVNGSSKVISGYFINPVPELKRKSQGLHGKNGVDLAAPTGTRVLASAPGKVIFAKYGWNGAYGNLVILEHANGTKTLYAHLSKINVSAGARVDRGQVIGLVGNTGRSTGPHLHFEVHGAKNPGSDWSWAKQ